MKQILGTIAISILAVTVLAGRWVFEERAHEIAISIDSTGDSSNAGLISVAFDTINLEEAGALIKSLSGALIVEASSEAARGFGLTDSAFMALQTYGMGIAPLTLDSRGQLGLPCTLFVNLANVGDTLFHRHLRFVTQVLDTSAADSLVDSITTANGKVLDGYTVRWELIGRD